MSESTNGKSRPLEATSFAGKVVAQVSDSSAAPVDVSILVPAKDEAGTIAQLVSEIAVSMATMPGYSYEIVFVDDGSTDGTWDRIVEATQGPVPVTGLQLRSNFGKAEALTTGLSVATGAIIVTMDADLQDDPAELPRMFARLAEGLDLVTGYKADRQDPLGKRLPSKFFNRMTGVFTGLKLNDHNSGLRVGYRTVYDVVPLYGELHRYVPALAHANGFKVAEIPVHHRPRTYGKSKYGLERYTRGALDLLTVVSITRYGRRPSHLLGGLGLIFGFVGSVILLYLLGEWIFTKEPIGTRPLLQLGILLLILSVQLVVMGLLAELVINRTHLMVGDQRAVRQVVMRSSDGAHGPAEQLTPVAADVRSELRATAVRATPGGPAHLG